MSRVAKRNLCITAMLSTVRIKGGIELLKSPSGSHPGVYLGFHEGLLGNEASTIRTRRQTSHRRKDATIPRLQDEVDSVC